MWLTPPWTLFITVPAPSSCKVPVVGAAGWGWGDIPWAFGNGRAGEGRGATGMAASRELKVEAFSVLVLEFPLKTKISVYSPKDRGFDLI